MYVPNSKEADKALLVSRITPDNKPSIEMTAKFIGKGRKATATALIDSGATGNILNQQFVTKHAIRTKQLEKPLPLRVADGTESKINQYAALTMQIEDSHGNIHEEEIKFYIANIGTQDVILGTGWLIKHNPDINWATYEIKMTRCPRDCKNYHKQPIKPKKKKTYNPSTSAVDVPEEEVTDTPDRWSIMEIINRKMELSDAPMYSNIAQKLAQEATKEKPSTSIPQWVQNFHEVFSEEKSHRFPTSKPWDHEINTKPGYMPRGCKLYPLSPAQQQAQDEWILQMEERGYIRKSMSPQASPFFFVGKKDGKLRPTQDYRYINGWTIRNDYPLPLISEIIDKLKGARYFTKLDVRWGYNNIRIKDGHQWKAAFKCNKGLYEPMVMFFGLCNSPATFQAMMNELFKDMIDEGIVIVYLDDILIFTDTIKAHREAVKRVLQILLDNDLFLKPEKCEFERTQIEYLGVIISYNHVSMDPVKVAGIKDWPRPTKVKDVQAYLGFCNFYRRFVQDFSKIARPLFELTKKDHEWKWTDACEQAFNTLKQTFTSAPMLVMPDTKKKLRIECDASDYATGAVLSQQETDKLWHPVAYLSKSLSEAERNYDIYDKELLAIIKALDAWRHYVEGCTHTIEILTDHKNLEYFKKAQKLSRRQARWAEFLSRFDFTLTHKPGKLNKVDGLSRRSDHKEGVNQDNMDRVLLPDQLFSKKSIEQDEEQIQQVRVSTTQMLRINHVQIKDMEKEIQYNEQKEQHLKEQIREYKQEAHDLKKQIQEATTMEDEVTKALPIIQRNGPRALSKGLQEWNYEDNLILYRGKVYVPKDLELRREIVKQHHNPPIMGHPGHYQTLELVSRTYWWPGMSQFIKNYVKGCATCQQTKINTHPTKEPLHPTEIPTKPFQIITQDLVTGLPESDGYDSILVITDRSTKTIITEPCNTTIDANGVADILIKSVFCKYGPAEKIISDRGPQFASQVMKATLRALGIRAALSTAFHPETDGASERAIQTTEQFLRAYCNNMQNDWAKLLPMASMAHNTHINSATKKIPFELLHGYLPTWPTLIQGDPFIPTVEERMKKLQNARKEAEAALRITAEAMKTQHDKYGTTGPDFQKGDKVWLEGTNLKTQYPSAKLAPKRQGPFEIVEPVGTGSYRLKLPQQWKIHPVIHASLLTPYHETKEHGINFTRPPADIINDIPEFEVESINKIRKYRNRWQYFIKWRGYPDSENTWEPMTNLQNSHDLIQQWHQENPSEPKPPSLSLAALRLPKDVIMGLRAKILSTGRHKYPQGQWL
jgi:hypothetical protein